jgi:hypothetical protein
MAEWLGRRTLNQKDVGSNPGEGTARLRVARISLRHVPLTLVKVANSALCHYSRY